MENKTSSDFHSAKTIIISSSCQINLRQHPPNHLVRGLFLWQAQLNGTPNCIESATKNLLLLSNVLKTHLCKSARFWSVSVCLLGFDHRDSWICSHYGHACVMCACVYCHDYLLCVGVQHSFTSTVPVRTIWDGEPRMATSTFTQLLNSEKSILYSVAHIYAVPCAPPFPTTQQPSLLSFWLSTSGFYYVHSYCEAHCTAHS